MVMVLIALSKKTSVSGPVRSVLNVVLFAGNWWEDRNQTVDNNTGAELTGKERVLPQDNPNVSIMNPCN
jgi:hypothetical protein